MDLFWLKYIPKNQLSNVVGRLVSCRYPKAFSSFTVRQFAQHFKINMEEAEHPLEAYPTISELFTRRLKAGARPIQGAEVFPADARIVSCGPVRKGEVLQIKDRPYALASLLHSTSDSEACEGGSFITSYLCPTDYHRVHSPVAGQVLSVRWIPGALWPVNSWGLRNVDGLFAANERIVIQIRGERGLVFVVMVGATNVGQMTLAFDSEIRTNTGRLQIFEKSYSKPHVVKAGDELGIFHMGSTVVTVFEKTYGVLSPEILEQSTRVGQAIPWRPQ